MELDPAFDSGSGCPVIDFGYYKDQPVALKRWSSNGFLLTKAIHKDLDAVSFLKKRLSFYMEGFHSVKAR